jgi:uncharacterized Rmd1/YagE family protein
VADADRKPARVRARFLGSRLKTRAFEVDKPLALHPLTIRAGERGLAMLFRFGAAALVDVTPVEEAAFYSALAEFVTEPVERPEIEELDFVLEAGAAERIDADGILHLQAADLPRLQIVAHALAKSAVLAWYEQRATELYDGVESLADELRRGGRGRRGRELARQTGDLLLAQARMVGRAEVADKPELTWDDPALDRLFVHLASEFELGERDRALTRKLDLAAQTVETYLSLLQNRQSLRVEWYIVLLIVVEIVLLLYQMAR